MIRSILKLKTKKVKGHGSIPYYDLFEYFELARIKLLNDIGLSDDVLKENGINFLISTAKANYITMLKSEEEVDIIAEIRDIHHNKLQIIYTVKRGEEEIDEVANGKTIHSYVNAGGRKLRIPDTVRQILNDSWGNNIDD